MRIYLLLSLLAVSLIGFYLLPTSTPEVTRAPKLSLQEEHSVLSQILLLAPAPAPDASQHEFLQWALTFVHTNSAHKIDSEFRKYAGNTPYILSMMLQVARDPSAPKPHLSCGPRALAMQRLVAERGLRSRPVQFYSDSFDTVQGHRVLEVFNPYSQAWEVWDPDYGVTYAARQSGIPVSATELVQSETLDHIEPRGISHAGWKETHTENLKENFFKAVLYEKIPFGMKDATILINKEKFNLEKRFSDGTTFEDYCRKHYGNPRFIFSPEAINEN